MRNPRQEKEHDSISHSSMDANRRGSSISTITLSRDRDMAEDRLGHNDEDGSSGSRLPNYRYVLLFVVTVTYDLLLQHPTSRSSLRQTM